MPRRISSHPLLRGIVDKAHELQVLTKLHWPSPVSEIRTGSQVLLHLPDVQSPIQYLIEMGLRPTLARHISSIYMEFVARFTQVFRSHFRRVIRRLPPSTLYYRDIFIIQFKGTIQVWESQLMSTVHAWLCRTGLPWTASHPQCMDVSATLRSSFARDNSFCVDVCRRCHEGWDSFKTRSQTKITRGKFWS
jgi:hypothetical protein